MSEFDETYYGSVRRNSGMDVYLIENYIPDAAAGEKGYFSLYNATEINNPYTPLPEDGIQRPLGCFGLNFKTQILRPLDIEQTDNLTWIEVASRDYFDTAYIFTNEHIIDNMLTKVTFEYLNSNDETVMKEVFPEGNLVEIKADDGDDLKDLKVTFVNAKDRRRVSVGAVIYGGKVKKIDSQVIENVITNEQGDITLGKQTSGSVEINLFEDVGTNWNMCLISPYYVNADQSVCRGKPKLFRILNDGITEENENDVFKTKIKGVDFVSSLTDDYVVDEALQFGILDSEEIGEIIDRANILNNGLFALQKDYDTFENNKRRIYHNYVTSTQSTIIHSICSYVFKFAYNDLDIVKLPLISDLLKKSVSIADITFDEIYSTPKEKKYPLISELTGNFSRTTLGNKELVIEEEAIFLAPYADAKIQLPNGYVVPNNENSLVLINGTEIGAGENAGLSYSSNDGYVYIYYGEGDVGGNVTVSIYAYKIENEKVFPYKLRLNDSGKPLTISYLVPQAPILSPQAAYFEPGIKEVYDLTEEYSCELRGRFEVGLYDVVNIELERNKIFKCIVTGHRLTFNGAYNSELKLIVLEYVGERLLPNKELLNGENLYPSTNLI